MEIIKKRIICDRCHKEIINKEDVASIDDIYCGHFYEFCYDCSEIYHEYEEQIKELWKKQDELTKEYKFGKHLPKYEENNDNNT